MSSIVKIFNGSVTGLFDLVLWPFRSVSPLWGLTIVSFLTGILMLWIFGKVSDQDTIRVIRDRVRGNLIGIRLFGDNLGTLFRLQGRLVRDNLIYMKYALLPLLVTIVPVLVILIQLNLRFTARPLAPGESAIVKVRVSDASVIERGVSLEAPEGVAVETAGVRVPALAEVAWRVRAGEPGRYKLLVRAGGEPVEKDLLVGTTWAAVSPRRTRTGVIDMLLFPGEPPVEASRMIESIEIKYEPLSLRLFGWTINWLVFFFLLSIASGFAFRRVLGVEI